jgi:hypothetical protein
MHPSSRRFIMGRRVYHSFDEEGFGMWLANDPTIEPLPTTSEWEIIRYRREEVIGPRNGEEKLTGNYLYGIVYRNKKGRVTLVGEAEEDYLTFTRSNIRAVK